MPYRDVILHACLHDMSYSPPVEFDRVAYLWEIIQLTGEVSFYEEQILAALPEATDVFDVEQLLEFAALFAKQGNNDARQLLYARFAEILAETGNGVGVETIVNLDGLDGFLYVADQFGPLISSKKYSDAAYHALLTAEAKFGKEEIELALRRASDSNSRIALYYEDMLEHRKKREEKAKERDRNIVRVYDPLQQKRIEVNAATLTYSQIKDWIVTKGGKVPAPLLYRWSEHAGDEALEQAALDLITEQNPDHILSYLRIFFERRFPLEPDRLIELAQGSDGIVAHWAFNALYHVNHPSVRALALKVLEEGRLRDKAVDLLINNYQDGDEAIIEQAIGESEDEEEIHGLGFATRELFEKHSSKDAVESLLLLYEKGPCSSCREKTVDLMLWLDVLPEWVREECRYDANFDIRALVEQEK
jgi:hypothetical protein